MRTLKERRAPKVLGKVGLRRPLCRVPKCQVAQRRVYKYPLLGEFFVPLVASTHCTPINGELSVLMTHSHQTLTSPRLIRTWRCPIEGIYTFFAVDCALWPEYNCQRAASPAISRLRCCVRLPTAEHLDSAPPQSSSTRTCTDQGTKFYGPKCESPQFLKSRYFQRLVPRSFPGSRGVAATRLGLALTPLELLAPKRQVQDSNDNHYHVMTAASRFRFAWSRDGIMMRCFTSKHRFI